ncbi:MAG TPA: hypothetical protein VGP80_09570 [Gemmatimonadales bacterium]|nr:hypothetical protein [Gemmatimonadales bacterium]
MSAPLLRWTVATALVLTGGLAAATPAHAGPPWISLEMPANPHEASTRGAFFLVHTYHHGTPTQYQLSGTAEGILNGRRQTIRLEITATDKPGVFAVRYSPAAQGVWVLALNMGEGHEGCGMLVTLGKQGQVASVQVPSREVEGGRWIVPRRVTSEDVDAALRQQTAMLGGNEPGDRGADGALLVAGLGLVLGIPAARMLRRR